MAADRRAEVTWEGNLVNGSGNIDSVGSGAFSDLPVTWASRTESSDGRTSPEELIAAAHASCYSMALSHGLNQAGTPPQRLSTSAVVTFVPGKGVTTSHITVVGIVPGIDEATFKAAAEGAKENCPVSKALQGNVAITLDASLHG